MSDFPRGWTLVSEVGAGSTASITVPAVAGVVHVLDSFSATILAVAAAAAGFAVAVTMSSSDGVFSGLVLALLGEPGGAIGSDVSSASGLDLAAGPGASLTIAFQGAAPANYDEMILIQGHDI